MRWLIGCAALGLLGIVCLAWSAQPTAMNSKAPEFAGISAWVNTKPLRLADLHGKVVAVHFWTFG